MYKVLRKVGVETGKGTSDDFILAHGLNKILRNLSCLVKAVAPVFIQQPQFKTTCITKTWHGWRRKKLNCSIADMSRFLLKCFYQIGHRFAAFLPQFKVNHGHAV